MVEFSREVFQFKITLNHLPIFPKVWRRIQVPGSFTFKELNLAIQMAMGWRDSHLHRFHIKGIKIAGPHSHVDDIFPFTMPDELWRDKDEAKTFIKDYFQTKKQKALYVYSFAACWNHIVVLEKIEEAKRGEEYPKCLAGEKACPPEDCCSAEDYAKLIAIVTQPLHEDYDIWTSWLESTGYPSFNPHTFSLATVFDKWDNKLYIH